MTLVRALESATTAERDTALKTLLSGALKPAFGALPKRELELLFVEALVHIGFLRKTPEVFELVRQLRITKSRARSLLYDRELRRQDSDSLDGLALEALKKPVLQPQGYAVALEIENPYLADHIRDRVRSLGFATDGSFSPSLIRLSAPAAAELIDSYLTGEERSRVQKALSSALGESSTAKDLMAKALVAAASAVAGKAGGELADAGIRLVGSFFEANESKIKQVVEPLLKSKRSDTLDG
jgi:hypothetical protein